MSTGPIELRPLELRPLTAADADWETVRARVVARLAVEAAGLWTDHNIPEPGIALTESAAFGLADLHYRLERAPLAGWPLAARAFEPASDRHWHTTLPEPGTGGGPGGIEPLADALAAAADELEPLVRDCASPVDAEALLTRAPWSGIFAPELRTTAIAVLRGALVRQVSLERTPVVVEELERAASLLPGGSPAEVQQRAVVLLTHRLGLWPAECAALIRRERRRRAGEALAARAAGLIEAQAVLVRLAGVGSAVAGSTGVTGPAGPLAALAAIDAELTAAGLSPQEVALARGLAPVPTVPAVPAAPPGPALAVPEDFERTTGESLLWPPHGIQALTCEPVTAEDYARVAREHPQVGRAWAVPGRLAGISWHGLPVVEPSSLPAGDPRRDWAVDPAASAVTLVVERVDGEGDQDEFLRDVLAVVGSEVRSPFPSWRDEVDSLDPRRVVCDEVGATLLATVEILVQATIVTGATVTTSAVVAGIEQRIAAFFAEARPESRPPGPDVAVGGGGPEISGPWPPAPQPSVGWPPGEPIRFSEVVERIVADPDVLGVADLYLKVTTDAAFTASSAGSLPIPHGAVPVLADPTCLTVTFTDSGGCTDG